MRCIVGEETYEMEVGLVGGGNQKPGDPPLCGQAV